MRGLLVLIFVVISTIAISGCGKEIGDSCSSSQNCPSGAMCDNSLPGGYCTITPCWPGECPDESVCIDFGHEQRFCMKRCTDQYDCREGYICRKDQKGHSFCYPSLK